MKNKITRDEKFQIVLEFLDEYHEEGVEEGLLHLQSLSDFRLWVESQREE